MSSDYYSREQLTNVDGAPILYSEFDEKTEKEALVEIEEKWNCTARTFGMLAAVDGYALRHNRLVGVFEVKTRPHESTRYSTVFFNLRKWMALMMAQAGFGVPAIYMVRFTDRNGWIRADDVSVDSGFRIDIGGTKRIVTTYTDVEPVFHVPLDRLRWWTPSASACPAQASPAAP